MKRNEDAAFLSKDELYSQLSETKLRIALLAQQESETEVMLGEGENVEDEKQFFEATEAGAMKAIHRQLRKQSVQHFLQRDLPKVGQIAAAMVLIFYLGLTAAVATVQSVRVSVMKLLYTVEEQYTEISFVPDEEASFDVPAEWQGSYYMSFIPNGYELTACASRSFQHEVVYTDSNGSIIRFSEIALQVESNIDTEGFSVKPFQLNGTTGLFAERADKVTLIWSTTDRYFVLSLVGHTEVAEQIAESVLRIK